MTRTKPKAKISVPPPTSRPPADPSTNGHAQTSEAGMKITAIAPWFGSKRTLAARIVEQLGPHSAYWEPFCGSMAVLLSKPESSHETVNDLHCDLTNLAWVLQSPRWSELYDRCARSIITEPLHLEAARRIKTDPCDFGQAVTDASVDRAYWFFIRSWWGRNGIVGAKGIGDSLAVRFTPGGGHGGIRFRSATETMPLWHERLRSVVVLRRDAFEVIDKIQDVAGVVIYADPPYLVKGSEYVHDFTPDDHRKLAKALNRFRLVRVVLSYYAHPLLAELYPDWTQLEMDVSKAMVSSGQRDKRGAQAAPEVLLINGPAARAAKISDAVDMFQGM